MQVLEVVVVVDLGRVLVARLCDNDGKIKSKVPLFSPPPSPEILFSRAEPPALILASRRSLRMRACSDALEGGALDSEAGEGWGVVSAILQVRGFNPWEWHSFFSGLAV